MKFLKLRNALVVAASAVSLVGIQAAPTFAATQTNTTQTKTATPQISNSLKLSPLRSDLTVQPGASGTVKVYVTNLTPAPVVLKSIENDFVAGDEKGTPSIILDENSYASSHSLKRFMVPVPNVTVAANSMQEVDLKVVVPKTAQAGGYFGALRFAPAGSGNQPVAVSSSVVSLILLTVPGPVVEQMALTNFDVQQNGGTATNFRTARDLALFVRFENKGNVQQAPFGQINVLKGKKAVYTYQFNQDDPRAEVLPDSARRWLVPIKNLGKFGKYTVVGTFGYGAKGTTINIEKTVWIVPATYILAAVIAAVALVSIIGGSWMFLRSYKRRILRSSRRRY